MPLAYPIHETTLDNGLSVVVSEDRTVPAVTVDAWVRVGSGHERPGQTGLAHLFEHLMFEGSANVAEGEHFAALQAAGGRCNATTWLDRTNYFETMPSGAFELAMWLEADRHGRLLPAVTQANLDNQRDVVKEEKRERYDNQPYGTALADLYALIYPEGHPYHHPTIGSMEDLDAASLKDVHDFYRRFYVPSNTTLTIVGDVDAGHAVDVAQRYFGDIPAAPQPAAPQPAALPPLTGVPRVMHDEEVPTDRMFFAFRLPAAGTREYMAAGLALDVLGGLATSRGYRRLVRQEELVTSLSAHPLGFVGGTSLGIVGFDAEDGVELARVEQAVCEELARLADGGPTDLEMQASIADSERSWLHALASMEERADLMAEYATLHGGAQGVNTHLDEVASITPDEVRAAAAAYLRPESRAVLAWDRSMRKAAA